MSKGRTSISSALGLSDQWVESNEKSINQEIDEFDTVSESIESTINRLKEEEFGKGDYSNSPFEKKLIFSGFMMAQEMMSRRNKSMQAAVLGHLFGEMLGKKPDGE
jgi:hypothetical protein